MNNQRFKKSQILTKFLSIKKCVQTIFTINRPLLIVISTAQQNMTAQIFSVNNNEL